MKASATPDDFIHKSKPRVGVNQVLIRVYYVGITQEDVSLYYDRKIPMQHIGTDFSGVIVHKHDSVENFHINESVFGFSSKGGAYAEYLVCDSSTLGRIPKGMTFQQAASLPDMWISAIQLLKIDAKFKQRSSVVVLNALTQRGQACVQLAQVMGCRRVHAIVSGYEAEKDVLKYLKLPTSLVDEVVPSCLLERDTGYMLALNRFDPDGVDCVIDLLNTPILKTSIMKAEGRYVMVNPSLHLSGKDIELIFQRPTTIHGSTVRGRDPKHYREHVEFITEHIIPKLLNKQLSFRITKICNWKNLGKAMLFVRQNEEHPGKVICKITEKVID